MKTTIPARMSPRRSRIEWTPSGIGGITWQDIMYALHGVDAGRMGMLFYLYADDPAGKHDFFAGLFIEAMQDPVIQQWREGGKPGAVERLCNMAITEWTHIAKPLSQEQRALEFGITRSMWRRYYAEVYDLILDIPAKWEVEIDEIVARRLR